MKDITYDDILKANENIKKITLKNDKTGKEVGDYVEVNQRVMAFRMVYPSGTILTDMLSNENGVCVFRAIIKNGDSVLATGTAYEKESSTFINKTSYIENCETSAVGRALGMAGFGIDGSLASAEEVSNGVANQEQPKASPKQIEVLKKLTEEGRKKACEKYGVKAIEELTVAQASDIISKMRGATK